MRFLWTAVRKDLGRLRRDPMGLATSLGIPLVLVTLITLVFGGGQAAPHGRLLVADEDGTLLSQALTGVNSPNQNQLTQLRMGIMHPTTDFVGNALASAAWDHQ